MTSDTGGAYATIESGVATVIVDGESPGTDWMAAVEEEVGQARTLFVSRLGTGWRITTVEDRAHVTHEEAHGVAIFLCRLRLATTVDAIVFHTTAGEIVIERGCSGGAAGEVLKLRTLPEIDAWIDTRQEQTISSLARTLRSPTGVIPFIGAGASAPFNYPLWGDFLVSNALGDEEKAEVSRLVQENRFEDAADIVSQGERKVTFDEHVAKAFGRPPTVADLKRQVVWRLPLIAAGPIITTNFDPVIESVYEAQGRAFTADQVLFSVLQPDATVAALQENRLALVKLHGDARNPNSRTFTAVEYKENYGNTENPGKLEQIATVLYTNRPLLFVGCSLMTDRTLASLKLVHARNPYLIHYAILAAPLSTQRLDERCRELEAAGIRPLWYRPRAYARVAEIVDKLVNLTAMDEVSEGRPQDFAHEPRSPTPPLEWWPDIPVEDAVQALLEDRLALFLGAAVHPRRMLGNEFYAALSREAGVSWPSRDRTDVAQHIAELDRQLGHRRLAETIERLLAEHYTQPSHVHHLLARLPGLLGDRRKKPLLILTTNYDTVLETMFEEVGEPYHLFMYQHHGAYAGRFLRRDPDGREYAIRVPTAVSDLSGARTIIVKLNGGLDPAARWRPASFVVASTDFEELSTRIPNVLPQVIWARLRECSVLFWGHGLREPDVRALTRRLRQQPERAQVPSWAVQLFGADAEYWRDVAGIEIVNADLGVYVQRFETVLRRRLAS